MSQEFIIQCTLHYLAGYGCDQDGTVVGRASAATFFGHRLHVCKLPWLWYPTDLKWEVIQAWQWWKELRGTRTRNCCWNSVRPTSFIHFQGQQLNQNLSLMYLYCCPWAVSTWWDRTNFPSGIQTRIFAKRDATNVFQNFKTIRKINYANNTPLFE